MSYNLQIHARDNRALPIGHRRSHFINYKGRGIYLVTLCTENRRPLLGDLCGDSPDSAYIRPTALGKAVLRCWRDIPVIQQRLAAERSVRSGTTCTRDIQLLGCQLMPDHFHGIIFIKQDMDIALGQVVRGFMMGCTQVYHEMLKSVSIPTVLPQLRLAGGIHTASSSSFSPTEQQTSLPVLRSANLPATAPTALQPLWEKGYHDRPLRRRGQLQNMLRYVEENPRRLYIRRHHAHYFHVQKDVQVGDYRFAAVGNMALIDSPLHAVHVRRRFTPEERRRYMNSCVVAARRGRVLISPFISDYEKQVRDVVLQEGFPVIQLTNEYLSQFYKPSGELFHACFQGQLLLLSPNDSPVPFSTRITREQCNQLNIITEAIADEE